jgi:nucleotidyltransferase substrate binding protein (TIGR01987 family)
MTEQKLDLTKLQKAVKSLESALEALKRGTPDKEQTKLMQAGLIQNFEFTYELSWKYMQRYLSMNNQIDKLTTNHLLFREAFENGLISNPVEWFDYHDARNKTSHMYSEEVADTVYNLAVKFLKSAKELLSNLEKINEQL